MRMGSNVNGYRVLPPVIRPELDAAALPTPDTSHASAAANVSVPASLASFLSVRSHLVRLAG